MRAENLVSHHSLTERPDQGQSAPIRADYLTPDRSQVRRHRAGFLPVRRSCQSRRMPRWQTSRWTLEEFTAPGIVIREPGGEEKPDIREFSDWARERYEAIRTFPEVSDTQNSPPFHDPLFITPNYVYDDISGKASSHGHVNGSDPAGSGDRQGVTL